MSIVKRVGFLVSAVAVLGLVACSAETASEGDVPMVDEVSIDARDQGSSYNGWSQGAALTFHPWLGYTGLDSQFNRTSGDATRGGGACLVRQQTGSSCSTDATCTTAAQAALGADAWGYCYSSVCYYRPGSQADYCAFNPNRTAGTITKTWASSATFPGTGSFYSLGCMTKTAGQNFACGGTDTSLYMRLVALSSTDYFTGP